MRRRLQIRTDSICGCKQLTLTALYGQNQGSLQSRCNFGEQLLRIFLMKIIAAIFDFYGSGRLKRKEICTKGVVNSKK